MAEIRWTSQAAEDLDSIAAFIFQDSPHYASLFVLQILKAVERLDRFPESGRIVPETNNPNIREILLGNYRIVYRLKYSTAEILTIYHGSRLLYPDSLN
ncbi:MAG: type II toxin-antitoxin system RelE/ParE family toxin [Pyrinomonadaceae bacterium]